MPVQNSVTPISAINPKRTGRNKETSMALVFNNRSLSVGEMSKRWMQQNGCTPKGHKLWTQEDDHRLFLTKDKFVASISHMFPGRSHTAIVARRNKLGFNRRKVSPWMTSEDRILREKAGTLNWSEIAGMLPGRSKASVQGRARYLGLDGISRTTSPKEYNMPLLDAVRRRAWEDGISLGALDRELRTGGYFAKNGCRKRTTSRDYVNIRHIKKAVDFFGGTLVIDWKDE